MRIGVVCTMNQARSPFAEAVLAQNFADAQIFSTGTKAIFGTPLMESVLAISKEWGLPPLKDRSTTIFNDENKILDSELILVAESEQKIEIANLGYSGEIKSFNEIFEDQDFTPQDPEGLDFQTLQRELGKVAAVTLRAVLDLTPLKNKNSIKAVIPHGVSDLGMAFAHAQMERTAHGAILIDADIRAPHDVEISAEELEKVYFDIQKLDEVDFSQILPNQILSHVREVDYPEKFFATPKWRNFLSKLSQEKPIVMITAPRHSQMRKLADSYLASYMADEFSVISC